MTKDPEASLAAIRAAGDDFEVLARCVKKAEWLEDTPGNHRQQYRGAAALPLPPTLFPSGVCTLGSVPPPTSHTRVLLLRLDGRATGAFGR